MRLQPLFVAKEQEYGLPSGYLGRTAQIESGGNPNARNPASSAGGLFQFINSTAKQYGLADRFDPEQATDAAARLARDNADILRQRLGREPTAGELYLAHQQGAGGAAKLLANPNASASSLVGEDAARLNGGGGTGGDLALRWMSKFDELPSSSIASEPMDAPAATTDNPMAATDKEGGLGGLGGFLRSDGFTDVLRAVSSSLLANEGGNWLGKVPEFLEHYQKQREVQNDRDAMQGLLRKAGLSEDEARGYAGNPTAARMALDLNRQEKDRASYGKFVGQLAPPSATTGAGAMDIDAAGPAQSTARNALLAPTSLTEAVPASSPTSSPQPNRTRAVYDQLQAESDRLYRVAASATTDDERQAAAAAIRANDAKLAYAQKAVDRMDEAPPGYQRTADGRTLEFIPGGPADPSVIAGNRQARPDHGPNIETFYDDQGRETRGYYDPATAKMVQVGGVKAPRPAGEGLELTMPDGTRISTGGQKPPSGFMVDPANPSQLKPIPGGPGEQVPGELAARIGLTDKFLEKAPDLRTKLAAGDASGLYDVFQARNNQSSEQAGVHRELEFGVEALTRMLTGAGMNMAEAEERSRRYLPTYTDDAGSMTKKLDDLTEYLRSTREAAMRGRGGSASGGSGASAPVDYKSKYGLE